MSCLSKGIHHLEQLLLRLLAPVWESLQDNNQLTQPEKPKHFHLPWPEMFAVPCIESECGFFHTYLSPPPLYLVDTYLTLEPFPPLG